ncbi:MAG: inorganic phosphate transporter [Pseudomonadota bacterium]
MEVGLVLLFGMTLLVAYSNGANDNFKGVATLFGSKVTTYKAAIAIATVATFAGSVCSVFLADSLVKAFSGKGLVPDAIAASPIFLIAVAAGAALTVILATIKGLPVSTTHGLTGALVGAGFVAAGGDLNLSQLGATFVMPLLFGPIISIGLAAPLYLTLHGASQRLGITRETCVCVESAQFVPVRLLQSNPSSQHYSMPLLEPFRNNVIIGSMKDCVDKYRGEFFGFSMQRIVDLVHYFSATAVSFARGLNDTPKIVALLVVVRAFDIRFGMVTIAAAMAIGGLLNARKVALTMSQKISKMTDGQALTANLVTAFLTIFASKLGLPVSTTHVSVGAIAGMGLVNGTADKRVLGTILLSWLFTLPMAALISGIAYIVIRATA